VLAVFIVLTFTFTWSLLPAARSSIAVSLVALCGPAVAAVVTAWWQGPDHLRALARRIVLWRTGARWYVIALLAPPGVSALSVTLQWLAGAAGPIHLQPISLLQAVVFVLVIGEEIGWRGYALPILLARTTALRASVALGVVWAFWHLPLFYMPEMPQFGSPFAPFVAYTVALSVILTALAQRSQGSVVIATLFHGAVNTIGFTNLAATPSQRGWANAVGYTLAALFAGAAALRMREPMAPTSDSPKIAV
jgi:membrane protease YdiL (CAAX protease family)